MKRIAINALVDLGCLLTFIPTLVTGPGALSLPPLREREGQQLEYLDGGIPA